LSIRVAINGYGRIGRCVHRQILHDPAIEVIAINSRSDAEMHAHLLKYDSIYGRCEAEISVPNKKTLIVNGSKISVFQADPPNGTPWKELEIDVVIEATGKLTTREETENHLIAGAKKVLITAPCKSLGVETIVMGVNHNSYNSNDKIVSNASCTTNCLAPILDVLDENFGIREGFFTTTHAATDSQNILDNSHKDFRRARSFLPSLIPAKTGAMKALGKVLPNLAGKIEGISMRVPVAIVSGLDLVVNLNKKTSVKEINEALEKKANLKDGGNILSVCHEQLVSIDFKGSPYSAIIDATSTKVLNNSCVKILAWYDNEWGYSARVLDLVKLIGI